MKKKNIIFGVLASSMLIATVFTLASCGKDPKVEAFEFAQTLGYKGTYEEWGNMLNTTDEDGRPIEVKLNNDKLVWKFVSENEWHDIYSINDIMGPAYDTFKVTYDSKGGTPVSAQNVKGMTKLTSPISTKEGYKLVSWNYNGVAWNFDDPVVSDLNLEANWKQLYKLNFLVEDSLITTQYYDTGDKITLPDAPTKEGYRFDHWTLDDKNFNDQVFDYDQDIDLIATFKKCYNVTFIDLGGNEILTSQYVEGDKITLPEFTSKKSKGWNVNGEIYSDSYTLDIPSDVEIYESLGKKSTYDIATPSYLYEWNDLKGINSEINNYINSPFVYLDHYYDTSKGKLDFNKLVNKTGFVKMIKDVTGQYIGETGYDFIQEGTGQAFKITLRDDLRWQDGDYITNEDFIYSMKQLLSDDYSRDDINSMYRDALNIHNALNYKLQGKLKWGSAVDFYSEYNSNLDDKLVFSLGNYEENKAITKSDEKILTGAVVTIGLNYGAEILAQLFADEDPRLSVSEIMKLQGKTLKEIKEDASLKNTLDIMTKVYSIIANNNILEFFLATKTFDTMDFDEVGLRAGQDKNELLVFFDDSVSMFLDDKLSKNATMLNFLPLVKEDVYERCKANNKLTYKTNVETSPSYGPYKITEIKGQTAYFELNPYWYGYNLDENKGYYQATNLVIHFDTGGEQDKIFEDGLIDLTDHFNIKTYGSSTHKVARDLSYANYLILQSEKNKMIQNQKPGVNKTILSNQNFRKAISFALNRQELKGISNGTQEDIKTLLPTGTRLQLADGDNNYISMVEYDGYKEMYCKLYGIDTSLYDDIDKAYDAIKTYDSEKAKDYLLKALKESMNEKDGYREGDSIELIFGIESKTEQNLAQFEFIKKSLINLVKGTILEEKLSINYKVESGRMDVAMLSGNIDLYVSMNGGGMYNPEFVLDSGVRYLNVLDEDTKNKKFTINISGNDQSLTLEEWVNSLYGYGPLYLMKGNVPDKTRFEVITTIEREIFDLGYMIPVSNLVRESLISEQIYFEDDYIDEIIDLNKVKFVKFKYDDKSFEQFIIDNPIDYTK